MFSTPKMKPFESGDIFLGLDEYNNEIGVRTDRHALTVAGARSGKGACAIIPNLLRWPHNVLVIDPKGENAIATWEARQAMGSNVYILDPFETKGVPEHLRASFNPLDGLDPDSLTGSADLEVIADGLVKRSDPKHAQWDDGAVTLLAGIMAYVLTVGEEDAKTLKSVRDILLLDREEIYAEAQEMKQCEAFDGIAQDAGSIIMGAFDNEKGMESDFLSAAKRHIKWINIKAMRNVLEDSSFSLSELKEGKASIYVVLPPEYLKSHSAFMRLFTLMAINAMAKGGSGRGEKCLFILDEFFSLGKLDVSAKAGLMPSYGVHLWPILQDLGQLLSLYGADESQTFFGNSDLHQFFGNTDQPTLEYMSKMTGVIGIDEIGVAPNAPTTMGGAPSIIGAASAHSKSGFVRGGGATIGAITGGIGQAVNASSQADYQDEMAQFQQRMATVNRPRATPDEMAKLVQCKDDVVANKMFCITHGADRLWLKPAPYFRSYGVIEPIEADERPIRKSQRNNVLMVFTAIGAVLGALLHLIGVGVTVWDMAGIGAFFGFIAGIFAYRAVQKERSDKLEAKLEKNAAAQKQTEV
jgi:Type IV secretory system Conjugative DNA transfer